MEEIKREFIKKNMTKEWLLSNGFHYNKLFNTIDTEVYTYRFPVYKYEGFLTILECELKVILGEENVYINVYDYKTINKYAPFYCTEYGGCNVILNEIWKKIINKLKKLGIVEEEKNHGNHKN